MTGKMLLHGIMHVNGHELRTIYALLATTKLTSLIMAKTKDIVKKDIDHFQALLDKEVAKLQHESDDELRLKLFLHFTKTLELNSADYSTPHVLEEKADEILLHTHEQMLQDAQYEQFVRQGEDRTIAQLIVQYQMQQIFSTFDSKLQQLEPKDALLFTAKITKFLSGLQAEKQFALQQRLQLDTLDAQAIYAAIQVYGMVSVLSTIVEVAGFAAYTPLLSAIATSATLFGISLPLGIYTGAASLLVIVTNPLFITALAIGGGGLLLYRQNKKLRQALLPIGMLQLLLPAMVDQNVNTDYKTLVKEWQKKLDIQAIYIQKIENTRANLALQQASITSLNTKLHFNAQKIIETQNTIQAIKQQLNDFRTAIKEDEKSAHFMELTAQIDALQTDINQLNQDISQNKQKRGLLNKIGGLLDNTSLKAKINQLTKKQQALIDERIEATIAMAPTAFIEDLAQLKEQIKNIENLTTEHNAYEQQKKAITKEIVDVKKTMYELETVLEKHRKAFYGVREYVWRIEGK